MAIIKQDFQAQSNSIASYDYVDIAEGTGIVKFYLAVSEDNGGNDYHLTNQELYSDEVDTAVTTFTGTSYAKVLDLDFDLSQFNKPKTTEGTGYISFSVYELSSCTAGQECFVYFIFRLKKGDVEIASATSKTYTFGYEASPVVRVDTGFIPITITQEHFKRGETMRLTMEAWTKKDASGGTGTFAIGHDPMNRDGTYINPSSDDPTSITRTEIHIPFRIDEVA